MTMQMSRFIGFRSHNSVGIEMQFQYRYQTLFGLCISIDIEILFHAVKSVILHLLIFQSS